jgi:polysaccharide export outer membrane protein
MFVVFSHHDTTGVLGAKMRFKAFAAILSICFGLQFAVAQQQPMKDRGAFGDSEYKLGPDDKIQVFVYGEPQLSTSVVVRPDGKVSVNMIGEMPAAGKTAVQLQGEIAQKLKQYVADPSVTVSVLEVNSPKVAVLGEVKKPGVYPIKNHATLIDALASAEGFTEYANKGKVIVMRTTSAGEEKRIPVNVDQLIKKGDTFYVLPGDKIYVQ